KQNKHTWKMVFCFMRFSLSAVFIDGLSICKNLYRRLIPTPVTQDRRKMGTTLWFWERFQYVAISSSFSITKYDLFLQKGDEISSLILFNVCSTRLGRQRSTLLTTIINGSSSAKAKLKCCLLVPASIPISGFTTSMA